MLGLRDRQKECVDLRALVLASATSAHVPPAHDSHLFRACRPSSDCGHARLNFALASSARTPSGSRRTLPPFRSVHASYDQPLLVGATARVRGLSQFGVKLSMLGLQGLQRDPHDKNRRPRLFANFLQNELSRVASLAEERGIANSACSIQWTGRDIVPKHAVQ
jgi:hypothetical protein